MVIFEKKKANPMNDYDKYKWPRVPVPLQWGKSAENPFGRISLILWRLEIKLTTLKITWNKDFVGKPGN